MKTIIRKIANIAIVTSMAISTFSFIGGYHTSSQRIPYQTFVEMAVNGDVDKVEIHDNSMTIYPFEGNKTYETVFVQDVEILQFLDEQEIITTTRANKESSFFLYSITMSLLAILYCVLNSQNIKISNEPKKDFNKKILEDSYEEKKKKVTEKRKLHSIQRMEDSLEKINDTAEKSEVVQKDNKEPIAAITEEKTVPPIEEISTPETKDNNSKKLVKPENKQVNIKKEESSKKENKQEEIEEPEELDFSDEAIPEPPTVDEIIPDVYMDEPPVPAIEIDDEPPAPVISLDDEPVSTTTSKKEEVKEEDYVIKSAVIAPEKKKPAFEAPKPLKKSMDKNKKNQKPLIKEESEKKEQIQELSKETLPLTEKQTLNEDDY